MRRLSTFRRGFVSTLGLDVMGRGLGALATILLIRSLSVDSFAYVVLFLNVAQFAGGALTGGLRMRYMRTEAERVSRGHEEPTGFGIALLASLALIVVVGAATLVVTAVANIGASPAQRFGFVVLTTVYTAGYAAVELAMFHHQARLEFARAGVIGALRNLMVFLVAIAATVGLIRDPVAVSLAMSLTICLIAAVTAGPPALATRLSRAGLEGRVGLGPESGWLTGYYLVSASFAYVAVFVVAALLDADAVASFGAAMRYFAIILGPVPSLLAVLRVRTSQYDMVDSSQHQVAMLVSWIKRSAPIVLLLFGGAAIAAPLVIPLVDGGRYPLSVPIFQLFLIGGFATYVTMPANNLLMTQRRFRLLAYTYFFALLGEAGLATLAALFVGVVAVGATNTAMSVVENAALTYLTLRPGTDRASGSPSEAGVDRSQAGVAIREHEI
jgi:O-antigen/teichoic acid export membrane protein